MLYSTSLASVVILLASATQSLGLSLTSRSNNPPNWQSTCSAAVNGLISGIEINILAQQGERNATQALQAIEAQSPIDPIAFAAGKAVLVNDIMFGMTIRRYNQLIAPAGNAALPGLTVVCTLADLRSQRCQVG